MNIYYHKYVGLDMRYYWIQILKFVPAFVPIIILEILLQHFFPSTGFSALIGQGIAYIVVFSAFMWMLGLNETEKSLVTGPLDRLLKKKA